MRSAFTYAWHGSEKKWDAVPYRLWAASLVACYLYWGLKFPRKYWIILRLVASRHYYWRNLRCIGRLRATLCWYPFMFYHPYGD